MEETKQIVLEKLFKQVLTQLDPDPEREGLLATPRRVASAMQFVTQGYETDPKEILLSALFKEEYRQMVVVKDIEMYSLCEHHLVPFFGKAHVAYIPNGYITGLSKIARVVDAFAHRLQVQERLTVQIRDCIQEALNPLGVAVVIEAHITIARRAETELRDHHFGLHRYLPQGQPHPGRIHAAYRTEPALTAQTACLPADGSQAATGCFTAKILSPAGHQPGGTPSRSLP